MPQRRNTDDLIEDIREERPELNGRQLQELADAVIRNDLFNRGPNHGLGNIIGDITAGQERAETGRYPGRGRPSALAVRVFNQIQNVRPARRFNIGAQFNGLQYIEEVDNKEFFIPSSNYCLIKCIFKFFGKEFDLDLVKNLNPYGNSTINYNKYINHYFKGQAAPSLVKCVKWDKKGASFETLNKKKLMSVGGIVLLLPISKNADYHAVLVKTSKYSGINMDNLLNAIKIKEVSELSGDNIHYKRSTIKERQDFFYAYDIETYTKTIEHTRLDGVKEQRQYQIPYQAGLARVSGKLLKEEDVTVFVGDDCLKQMLDHIHEKEGNTTVQLFAHNGGRFDHIFLKGVKGTNLLSEYASGGSIKIMNFSYPIEKNKDYFTKIVCKDSFHFMLQPLKKCPGLFGLEDQKMDFDIANKSKEWFINNEQSIKKYLKYDVIVLGQCLLRFEQLLNKIGESVTTNSGTPTIAWSILNKVSFGLKNIYLSKDPVTSKFFKDSCYGGRIIHYRKRFTPEDGLLISIDANSLYPSAMKKGMFPVGKHKVMNEDDIKDFNKFIGNFLYIVEVEMDAKNTRYPLMPYKHEDGRLLYPAQTFRGVYNSIDLEEALNDGYEIKKIHKGVYWLRSENIFEDFISGLYNKRKQYKKEGNAMEYVIKIILNSSYGKMLEEIDSNTIFSKTVDDKKLKVKTLRESILLNNGQYQHKEKVERILYQKPIHIGSFILSYARKIMNNTIRAVKPESVYYSDTDSIYLTKEAFEKSGLKEELDLGGFKNDYGEGTYIKEAYFLDLKRYLLFFNDGSYKVKFNGINFKENKLWKNYSENVDDNVLEFYKYLYDNPKVNIDKNIVQTKWIRTKKDVYICEKEMTFAVNNTARYEWRGNISFPFDYDFEKAGKELGNGTEWVEEKPINYSLTSKGGMNCVLPITADIEKEFGKKGDILVDHDDSDTESKIIKDADGVRYFRAIEKTYSISEKDKMDGKDPIVIENEVFYSFSEFGISERVSEEDVKKPYKKILIGQSNDSDIFPKLNVAETNKLLNIYTEILDRCV